jgi:predicted DCC family thiol-disulfide oxidoreductase YuxK
MHAAYSYRDDASVPAFPDDKPLIIFDGRCVLCSNFAQFVLRHDRNARFRLMAAQTPLGQAIYRHYNLDPVNFETNLLLQQGHAYRKSAAAIRIFSQLGLPWSLIKAASWIPRRMLDPLYDIVARNRLKWFGSRSQCFLADPSYRDRFLG